MRASISATSWPRARRGCGWSRCASSGSRCARRAGSWATSRPTCPCGRTGWRGWVDIGRLDLRPVLQAGTGSGGGTMPTLPDLALDVTARRLRLGEAPFDNLAGRWSARAGFWSAASLRGRIEGSEASLDLRTRNRAGALTLRADDAGWLIRGFADFWTAASAAAGFGSRPSCATVAACRAAAATCASATSRSTAPPWSPASSRSPRSAVSATRWAAAACPWTCSSPRSRWRASGSACGRRGWSGPTSVPAPTAPSI